jgi:glycosyltransferase involved in cell wall biosynthesis
MYGLARHVAAAGHDVRVVTTNANGLYDVLDAKPGQQVALEAGVSVRYYRRFGRHSLAPALMAALPSALGWADVVHLNSVYSFPTIPTLGLSRVLRKPLVWSPRGALQRWEGSTRTRAKQVWEAMCRSVAPNPLLLTTTSSAEASASLQHFPSARMSVVPNGIDIPPCVTHQDDSETLRLLYVGRLHPIKGIEQLLDACALLGAAGVTRWCLSIAGDGDAAYVKALRSSVARLGLQDRVRLLGYTGDADKEALYRTSDLLVLPSYVENFGLVAAEALVHGIPVVASRGTPWSRLDQVGAGAWVDNDPNVLATTIARLAHMPLREMGARGRAWVEQEFSWPTVTAQMLLVYANALAIHPVQRRTT